MVIVEILSLSDYTYIRNKQIEYVSYNDFLKLVKEDKVDTVTYSISEELMTFTLFNEETKDMTIEERQKYRGYLPKDIKKTYYAAYEEVDGETVRCPVNVQLTPTGEPNEYTITVYYGGTS